MLDASETDRYEPSDKGGLGKQPVLLITDPETQCLGGLVIRRRWSGVGVGEIQRGKLG